MSNPAGGLGGAVSLPAGPEQSPGGGSGGKAPEKILNFSSEITIETLIFIPTPQLAFQWCIKERDSCYFDEYWHPGVARVTIILYQKYLIKTKQNKTKNIAFFFPKPSLGAHTIHGLSFVLRTPLAYFFGIFSPIKMKFGQILVCCMKNVSNMFLVQSWRLETSSRPFYDFIETTI